MLASAENSVRIWTFNESSALEKLHDMKSHDNLIDCLKFSNDNVIGSMSRDLFKFWDIRETTVRPLRTEKKGKSDFITFDWNKSQSTIYTVLTK